VTLCGAICPVSTLTDTQIECTLGLNSANDCPVVVLISPNGLANSNSIFSYGLSVSSISKTQSKNSSEAFIQQLNFD
jgi:hypothetical protein